MMSPIEKVTARSAALDALGLSSAASPEDIRNAWRRLAFNTHPDKMAGEATAFLTAKAAFEYLGGKGKTFGAPGKWEPAFEDGPAGAERHPRPRPGIVAQTETLGKDDIASGRALLENDPVEGATDHVVEALERKGRSLVYMVPGAAGAGLNRVALPAAILSGCRGKVRPTVVTFDLLGASADEYVVADETRHAMFPGAREVRIRFCGSSDCRGAA